MKPRKKSIYRVTHEQLLGLYNYDKETGMFSKIKKFGKTKIGSINNKGYLQITINGICYKSYRLAWLYVYGSWPKNTIDHINGDKLDNRIKNLRDVTHRENMQNLKSHRFGKLLGCCYSKQIKRWVSIINQNGKSKFIGSFKTEIEAHLSWVNFVNKNNTQKVVESI